MGGSVNGGGGSSGESSSSSVVPPQLCIGIVASARGPWQPEAGYLLQTFTSLLSAMTPQERAGVCLSVFGPALSVS